ncbi:hypothetical protein GGH97_002827 [Coemansia sp. RSA 475]|nr:hypothetical protein GGH97_002827 [Coemansia sp. RSA 475]
MGNTLVNIPASQTQQLKSFGLTHFQYQDGDHFGELLALVSLAPIFIIVAETTIVFSRREITGILLLCGQLLNELFNLVLKLAICEPRPHEHLGDGYGMPSSHSQFMGFFAVYVLMYFESQITTNIVQKRCVQIGAIVLSVLVVVSRVYLGYHTLRQVLAGVGIGVVAGIAWYQFVELVRRTGILDYALRSGICHWLLIRDSRNVTDIALVEYNLSMNQKLKTL